MKNYSLRVGARLYNRIAKHFQFLKHLNNFKNQREWIEKAVLEKLSRDEEKDLNERIPAEKHLSFKISSELDEKIEEKVELIKKFRSFSKKLWILEAIQEKIDIDGNEVEEKARKIFNSMLKNFDETSNISR